MGNTELAQSVVDQIRDAGDEPGCLGWVFPVECEHGAKLVGASTPPLDPARIAAAIQEACSRLGHGVT